MDREARNLTRPPNHAEQDTAGSASVAKVTERRVRFACSADFGLVRQSFRRKLP